MSYQAAIDQLNAMTPELHTQPGQPRRKFSLDEIGILLDALGNPHWSFPSVLIAGTNGKGSTASTLASILKESGQRTGLYTSPHLARPNERIRINGVEVSDEAFAGLYFRVHSCGHKLVQAGTLAQLPSFFETLTAMAFLHFADAAVDIAVLEVGMGGRLDATNIVTPLVSVITDISLDHTEWLGSTIAAITREKAGILRANGTLITLPQHPEANQVLGEIATELDVRGVSAVPFMPPTEVGSGDTYRLQVLGSSVEVASPLHGAHQHRNVALAIATAVELAAHHGVPITPASIERGIHNTRWPARLEQFVSHSADDSAPTQWILDVAHNPAGAWALRAAVRNLLDAAKVPGATLLFSCLRDKPVAEMAQILFPLFDEVIFAPIHSPRATPMVDLLAAAEATGTPARAATSVAQAIEWAKTSVRTAVKRAAQSAPCAMEAAVSTVIELAAQPAPCAVDASVSSAIKREAPFAPRAMDVSVSSAIERAAPFAPRAMDVSVSSAIERAAPFAPREVDVSVSSAIERAAPFAPRAMDVSVSSAIERAAPFAPREVDVSVSSAIERAAPFAPREVVVVVAGSVYLVGEVRSLLLARVPQPAGAPS